MAPRPQKESSKTRMKLPANASNATPSQLLPPKAKPGPESGYRPEFADDVKYLCTLGATDMEIATFFGVTIPTIHDWRFRHAEFAAAITAGKSAADDRVERSLFMNAVGFEYDALEVFVIDKTIVEHKVRKRVQPNTVAQIFWLKNRRKELWRDVHQLEHGQVGDFDKLTDIELAQRMAESAKSLAELQRKLPAPGAKKNGIGKGMN
jgi:hypothetical protein